MKYIIILLFSLQFSAGAALINAAIVNKQHIKSIRDITIEPDSLYRSCGFQEIDSLLVQAIRDSVFPGASALIYSKGQIVYEKVFGHFTYDDHSPKVTKKTLWDLASLTKVIATTTAAMILIDEGMIDPEEKTCRYIPEFGNNGKDSITIQNLLLHNSGLPAGKNFTSSCKTADEVLAEIYSMPLKNPVGRVTVYSDLGMIMMGKVIERVSGMPLNEFCRKRIFQPLGMRSTQFHPSIFKENCAPTEYDSLWRKRLIQGEVHDETASLLNGISGNAGLFSNAKDIAVLAKILLKKGLYKGKRFISEETITKFTHRFSLASSRGLGWDTKINDSTSAGSKLSLGSFGHTGFTGTSIWIDPNNDCFIILLTNRVFPTRSNQRLIRFRPIFHDAVINTLFN